MNCLADVQQLLIIFAIRKYFQKWVGVLSSFVSKSWHKNDISVGHVQETNIKSQMHCFWFLRPTRCNCCAMACSKCKELPLSQWITDFWGFFTFWAILAYCACHTNTVAFFHFNDKIKLILYPRVEKSITHLTMLLLQRH
jgi:hypothetical protein